MTEFNVEVIKLDKIQKHPNADTLSIATVFDNYPVVFKTDSFLDNDKAVYIPVDSLVPLDNDLFSFLSSDITKKQHRIKARNLRGIFSMGMLVPAREDWQVGENVQEKLNIEKWEPKLNANINSHCEQLSDPQIIPVYTDLSSLRKFSKVLVDGERVIVTEKIHGTNARYVYHDGEFYVGTHRTFQKRNEQNTWWRIAAQYNLEQKLKTIPGIALYGEIYGSIQDLKYNHTPNEISFCVFDAYDTKEQRYLSTKDFVYLLFQLELSSPPVLFAGPWHKKLWDLAEGKSAIASHVKEGIVVAPVDERWEHGCGRVKFKLVGKDYLLRK